MVGFHPLFFKQRLGMRGGGIGFYIKNNISWQIVEECSPFQNKIIESLTLLLSLSNNTKMLISSVYRMKCCKTSPVLINYYSLPMHLMIFLPSYWLKTFFHTYLLIQTLI